ncbi:phage holin family protein [Pelomonas sp. P7]|uniref:Phage holin family protein n=1 Tax=Pelomonas caseinilytica TaxID=2906763 RepID=A0ABS8X725_9BURK|nr:phage holin family protein [Pelomonas sp. P7]MCE4536306.1 phage holin family protein [Pelomonas sp. P7]
MAEPTPDTHAAGPASPGLPQQLHGLWRDVQGLVSDRVELLSLELQRAVQALIQIVALLVAVAILGVTAWLVLWGALIRLLVSAGMPLAGALLLAIAFNVVVMALAVMRVKRLLPQLRLPATRRHLMLSPDPRPQPPAATAPTDEPPAVPDPAAR